MVSGAGIREMGGALDAPLTALAATRAMQVRNIRVAYGNDQPLSASAAAARAPAIRNDTSLGPTISP